MTLPQYNNLKEFAESLAKKFGIQDESQITRVEEEARAEIGFHILSEMDDNTLEQFVELVKKKDISSDEIFQFYKNHIPNFLQKVRETLEDFSQNYKGKI